MLKKEQYLSGTALEALMDSTAHEAKEKRRVRSKRRKRIEWVDEKVMVAAQLFHYLRISTATNS